MCLSTTAFAWPAIALAERSLFALLPGMTRFRDIAAHPDRERHCKLDTLFGEMYCEIDATLLADDDAPYDVYGQLIDSQMFAEVCLRVRPTNCAVQRLCVDAAGEWLPELRAKVLKFRNVRLDVRPGQIIVVTAVVLRDAADDDALLADIEADIANHPPAHALAEAVVYYDRLTTPQAALLVLCDARCLALCAALFPEVGALLRQETDVSFGVESADSTPPKGFHQWRCAKAVALSDKNGVHAWTLLCCVGPLATRARVRARINELTHADAYHLVQRAAKYVRVLAYEPPPERIVDVDALMESSFLRSARARRDRGHRIANALPTGEALTLPYNWHQEFFFSRASAAELADRLDYDIEAYVARYAPHFFEPLACSHYRWSYQHGVCRDYVIVLLDAHPSDAPHLPPYIVLAILEWLDAEFVRRATEHQLVRLIVNVAASVKRVRAARLAPPASRKKRVAKQAK